jgi:biotin carboxylase
MHSVGRAEAAPLTVKHVAFFETIEAGYKAIEAARRRNYRVTVFRGRAQARFSPTPRALRATAAVDEVIELDDLDDLPAMLRCVEDLHARHPVTAIVPLWDNTVHCSAAAAALLRLTHPSVASVQKCRNKCRTREMLRQANVPSIAFASATSEAEVLERGAALGFPLFFKPATGSASLFAQPVLSEPELIRVYRHFATEAQRIGFFGGAPLGAEVLVEEILRGTMTSAEVAIAHDRIWVMAVGERKRWVENDAIELGTSMPPETLPAADVKSCADYAKEVVTALGLEVGMFHLEIMLTPEGPRLIEANPRVMGGNGPFLLTEFLGEDVFDLLLDIHEGGKLGDRTDCNSSRAVMSHVLASGRDCRVPPFDESTLAFVREFSDTLVSFRLNLQPGQELRQVASNFDYFGGFQMRGQTISDAARTVAAFHRKLAEALQVPLAY